MYSSEQRRTNPNVEQRSKGILTRVRYNENPHASLMVEKVMGHHGFLLSITARAEHASHLTPAPPNHACQVEGIDHWTELDRSKTI